MNYLVLIITVVCRSFVSAEYVYAVWKMAEYFNSAWILAFWILVLPILPINYELKHSGNITNGDDNNAQRS